MIKQFDLVGRHERFHGLRSSPSDFQFVVMFNFHSEEQSTSIHLLFHDLLNECGRMYKFMADETEIHVKIDRSAVVAYVAKHTDNAQREHSSTPFHRHVEAIDGNKAHHQQPLNIHFDSKT